MPETKPLRRRTRTRTPPAPDMGWAWFFDIDGTLVEIASTPANVVVPCELPKLIVELHHLTGGAVSLITGRTIADVDRFLPLPGISVAGQHGLNVRTADGRMLMRPVNELALGQIRTALGEISARYPSLTVEFKGGSIALHYRAAPALAGYAHILMRKLAARHAPEFVIQKGKRIVELRPAAVDKGMAIRSLMSTEPFAGRVPVFLGDDVTDEIGFEVVNEMSGYSIKVGKGRTSAKWRLRDVASVRDWLKAGIDKSGDR